MRFGQPFYRRESEAEPDGVAMITADEGFEHSPSQLRIDPRPGVGDFDRYPAAARAGAKRDPPGRPVAHVLDRIRHQVLNDARQDSDSRRNLDWIAGLDDDGDVLLGCGFGTISPHARPDDIDGSARLGDA